MSDVIITTGDDVDFLQQVTKDGVDLVIDISAVVKSRIVSQDRQTVYTDEITAVSTDEGADWATGLISLPYPSAITEAINNTNIPFNKGTSQAIVETQIDDNGKKSTAFDSITIAKGNVS